MADGKRTKPSKSKREKLFSFFGRSKRSGPQEQHVSEPTAQVASSSAPSIVAPSVSPTNEPPYLSSVEPLVSSSNRLSTPSSIRSLIPSPNESSHVCSIEQSDLNLARASNLEGESGTDDVQDLWSRACQQLDAKSRKWIDNMSANGKSTEIHDLIPLVRQREGEYKDATWALKVGDRKIIWRDYADRVVMWVTAIGDIAINFAPAPSPIVWSALKVLMKANVSQCEDLVAIFGCAEKVLHAARRGRIYEIVYLGNALNNSEAVESLEEALISLYKACLELLFHAFTRLNKGQGQQFLHAFIHAGQGEKVLSTLTGCEHNLAMAVQACGAVEQQSHRELLRSFDEPLRRIDNRVEKLLEAVLRRDLDEALDYISPIPVGKHHLVITEARTPGTCDWLLKHKRFTDWEESSWSSTLWLQGKIGAGKSFLTSKVINRYKSGQKVEHDEGFAYFYCSRSDAARMSTNSVLQSYIRQLSQVPHHPDKMHKNTYNLYLKAKADKRPFSYIECKTLLLELVNSYPRTTLILDALDECDMGTRGSLPKTLLELVQKSKNPVKVFIASRKETDIEKFLNSRNLVEISTSDNKDDIGRYIQKEMNKSGGAWPSFPDDLKETVKKTIMDQSDGMFRWAYLQWVQLREEQTQEDVRDRLGMLPGDLKEAYDELYLKHKGRHAEIILQRAVKWVLCAQRPLNSNVLLWAVRLNSQKDGDAADTRNLSDFISESSFGSICSHLIVKDSQLKVWKFPHASVAEYFEVTHREWVEKAREDVAVLLLSNLINCHWNWEPQRSEYDVRKFLNQEPDLENHLDPRHPLQKYTFQFWLSHVKSTAIPGQTPTRTSQALKRFLGDAGHQKSSSRQYQAWCTRRTVESWDDDTRDIKPFKKAIFGICILGFHEFLNGWWDQNIDVSQVNENGLDLLAIAAKYGHSGLCSDLIERGADVNRMLDSDWGSALAEAIDNGQVETTELLLARGCNPNLISKGQSAICYAAGREQILEMLLEAGANPNLQCERCSFGCVLENACYYNAIDSAILLIKYGADANLATEKGFYGSALAAAAAGGSADCIRLLVEEHGADVNAYLKHGNYGSALAAAAAGGSAECVRLLVEEHGADVNAYLEHGNYGSVLAAAAARGSVECIRLLVEKHGADVNAYLKHGNYGSVLAAAAARGSADYIRLLVEEHGADVNTYLEHGNYGSVLAAAAAGGSVECVRLLVEEHGADVNAYLEHGNYGSALAAAAARGSADCIRLLVEHGADVNAYLKHGNYGSALAAAAARGSADCIRLLVEHGADVNAYLKHGNYGSALAAAAAEGSAECIRLLVEEHGADVNAYLEHGNYGSALAAAAEGSVECVRLLVEHGADVNAYLKHGNYGSALAAAAAGGSAECVRLLVEEHGADVNAYLKHGNYGSALAAAILGWKRTIEIVKYLIEEAGADPNILSSNPPAKKPDMNSHYSSRRRAKAEYLVKGGYVKRKILIDFGLPEAEVPEDIEEMVVEQTDGTGGKKGGGDKV